MTGGGTLTLAAPEPIRLRTLVLLRWIAVAGQLAAVLGARVLGVQVPLAPVLAVIAAAALANAALMRSRQRPDGRGVALHLGFDLAQVTLLVALTGGLSNPFAMLIIAPATIAATALGRREALALGVATVGMISAAGLLSTPMRLDDGTPLRVPALIEVGHGVALLVTLLFVAAYAHRVAQELRATGQALAATQLALEREQRLQHLGGVVAAAAHELGTPLGTIKLVASELGEVLADREDLAADLALLRDSADRCRDILRGMGRAGRDDLMLRHAPLSALLAEAVEPHAARARIAAVLVPPAPGAPEPLLRRDAGAIHGLRNIVQNAADFASARVTVRAAWDAAEITITVADDGPGYPAGWLGRLGEPFLSSRRNPGSGEGMGLGLFIARSLLARSGAAVAFRNPPGGGAEAEVRWPRRAIEADAPAALGRNPLIAG